MNCLPVVDNTQMEGTVSPIFDIGPSFYSMIKNGKLFVPRFTLKPVHSILKRELL